MELEMLSKRENPLLNRMEIKFKVSHADGKTPNRNGIREHLASAMKVKKELIVVDHVKSQFGIGESHGYAKVYKTKQDAIKTEPDHMLKRNKLLEEEKPKEQAPKEEPPKEQAPKEELPKEEEKPQKKEGDE